MRIFNQTRTMELQLSDLDLRLGRLLYGKMRVTDANGNKSLESIRVYVPSISRAKAEIKAIKAMLKNTDYQAIKYAEGELSSAEYEITKERRRAWRVRINELEDFIKKFSSDD